MDDEFIKDLAIKFANVGKVKSNFPHDWNSSYEGYYEGFKTAVRLIETERESQNVNASDERVVCFNCGNITEHDGEGHWCFDCKKYTPF